MVTVDAHRDGKRVVVTADEKLRAFLELQRVTANHSASQMPNDLAPSSPGTHCACVQFSTEAFEWHKKEKTEHHSMAT
jgi:type II secretory pathway component PulL